MECLNIFIIHLSLEICLMFILNMLKAFLGKHPGNKLESVHTYELQTQFINVSL